MFASQIPTHSRVVKRAGRPLGIALTTLLAAGLLSGCAHLGKEAIPSSAAVRAEGNGQLVAYTPEARGNAYVYDATEGKLLWSGKVDRQDNVAVDTKINAITVDGKPVHTRNVPKGHDYRIYFEPRDQ
jgi:hypothetical protein